MKKIYIFLILLAFIFGNLLSSVVYDKYSDYKKENSEITISYNGDWICSGKQTYSLCTRTEGDNVWTISYYKLMTRANG